MRIRLTRIARQDIQHILRHSESEFGETVRGRYKRLLDQAILDLAEDVGRIGVRSVDDLRPGYFVYHLMWARSRTPRPTVKRPRHLLLFSVVEETVTLAAVVHERELLERHLED